MVMHIPHIFQDLNMVSVAVRLLMALVFGGVIGLERGANRHPAGFRTHILVCVGSTLAMMTNVYVFDLWGSVTDPVRLGAQVITGVGFLGAGTILLTGRHRIRGLTTAAGLWASACLGLAIGAGFYEGAIGGAIVIFVSLSLLPRLENYAYRHSGIINLYIEVEALRMYRAIIDGVRKEGLKIYEVHLDSGDTLTPGGVAFVISIKRPKDKSEEAIIGELTEMEGVTLVDQI